MGKFKTQYSSYFYHTVVPLERRNLAWHAQSINLIGTWTLRGIQVPEHVQLVKTGEADEGQVPQHQDHAVLLVELPSVEVRRHDQEYDGGQQRQGGVCEPFAVHVDMAARCDDCRLHEPGKPQTDEDIEDVAPDSVRHRHVAVALLDDSQAGQRVRHTDSGSHEGEPHDGVRDAQRGADDCDHPDHDV